MNDFPNLPLIFIERNEFDEDKYINTPVSELNPNINEYGIYVDSVSKEPVFIYAPFVGNLAEFRNAVLKANIGTTSRASGMVNRSTTFGMAPRNVVLKRESCKPTSMSYKQPEIHEVLVKQSESLAAMLKFYLPNQFQKDSLVMQQVEADWRISDSNLWTSGVINQSSALPYHRDRNNFETWSAMPVLRRGMRGGHLHIPSYDAVLANRDGSITIFNGFRLTHGVTPMKAYMQSGYRYSIVYYALRGMKDCHSTALEYSEGLKRRTRRESDIQVKTSDLDI